jgi:N-glycosylase/DNA lyase
MGGYFAFPTLESLSKCDEKFFVEAGAGYRANYLVDTINKLVSYDIQSLKELPTPQARKTLCEFKGIGGKVADCILLFALSRKDVYPVDTWMEKVYYDSYYAGDKNAEEIRAYMTNFFGELSGYAQQYLFYYKRELK